jgi:hypothetical protein
VLTSEQAKERLAQWQIAKPDDKRNSSVIDRLPAELRDLSKRILQLHEEEPERLEPDQALRRLRNAAIEFDSLSPAQRAPIFQAIAPNLATAIESTWQLLKTAPYQVSYERKAFRVPTHPQVTVESRLNWLGTIFTYGQIYQPDVLTPAWVAAWAAHLNFGYSAPSICFGPLLAAVLNEQTAEADEVFEILRQSITNEHEIGGMGRHVTTALLMSNRPEGWELIEKTLLAAQRQEGLRQVILETIDETHPEAFRRMLRLILDHDLVRFASVVRAFDVWFGQLWGAASAGIIKKMLAQVVSYLEDPAARDKAINSKDAEAAYLALWCLATEDAVASIPPAEKLLQSKSVELRYIAARHLAVLDLDVASIALIPALDDADLRVALTAVPTARYRTDFHELPGLKTDNRFEKIEQLLDRVPDKPTKLKPLVWPWTELNVKQSDVAGCLLFTRGNRPAVRLLPHMRRMETYTRGYAAEAIIGTNPWDEDTRRAIVEMAGEAASYVREEALEALANTAVTAAEAEQLEGYLTRKTGDLRRGVLAVLLNQTDEIGFASARRLLAAKDANQRVGGLELLRQLADANRSADECRRMAAEYQAARPKLTKDERSHLDHLRREKNTVAALDDALGLMNPADRTPVAPPRNLDVKFITPAAVACLKALDDLVHEHREESIHVKYRDTEMDLLLGTASWNFPSPDFAKPPTGQQAALPLAEVWLDWFKNRPVAQRDDDGRELVRAMTWKDFGPWDETEWNAWAETSSQCAEVSRILSGGQSRVELRYDRVVAQVVAWLMFLNPIDARDYLLDAIESAYSLVPPAELQKLMRPATTREARTNEPDDWRSAKQFELWTGAIADFTRATRLELTPEQEARYWKILHWRDEPLPGAARARMLSYHLLIAYEQRAANLADVADQLLGPRGYSRYTNSFELLSRFTSRTRSKEDVAWLAKHPEVQQLVDRAIARILDLELGRGDTPTAATDSVAAIGALWGIETLHRILQALGETEFKLGSSWRSETLGRRESLTKLAKVTFPKPDETSEDFAKLMRDAVREKHFPEDRLLQLAFLAPQWTKHLEAYFGWEQMSEGVYWFLAHMRSIGGSEENAALAAGVEGDPESSSDDDSAAKPADTTDSEDADSADETSGDAPAPPRRKLSAWERLIIERTPLTDADRGEGAIDVAWFRRTHELLGDKHWQALAAAARFAANASQAKQAKFIAEVLLNKVKRQALIDGITKKQLKDHVRMLGLLPLATGTKRDADLAKRCQVLREYRRYANQLSGLTKPSALRAWEIGMKNLAQTAGFPDPLRLEWAIGAESVKDLAKGPVTLTKKGVAVTLALDELSKPNITVMKGEKQLKSIPPDIKKDKQVAALTGRATDLKRQATGIRQSLEAAMCRGDAFSGDELRSWCNHALLWPLLSRLVILGEGIAGYPDKGGKALRDYRGKLEPVKAKEKLRLAHPFDLLKSDHWHDWQKECFQSERVQPFKQVFRELYVVTKQEKQDGAVSHRYDGQQVQQTQALALFGSRGWDTRDGIFKVFHDAELTASVYFNSGITTPLEVEGATLAGVSFTRRNDWKPVELTDVPPRLFSEVMRDLDLVVSVAHAGGVDPEASASTVEMRAGLLRETCALLKMKNVRLKANQVIIDGDLAQYTVHLGSGTVHKMPGGALCIVPVHAQHRGRLFLPFADDDPRTAEVVSKVMLLARDREIQDPSILEQIRA